MAIKKTENFKKMNDREREVYLSVCNILDKTSESNEFTQRLKIALEDY